MSVDKGVLTTTLFGACLFTLGACADTGDPMVESLVLTHESGASAAAVSEVSVTITAITSTGDPVEDALLVVSVERGGGSVTPTEAKTESNGQASLVWTLGVAPVLNRLTVTSGEVQASTDVSATLEMPYSPEEFGDIETYLDSIGNESSTEGIVFDREGRLTLGVGESILNVAVTGEVSERTLHGDSLVQALGLTVDNEGKLWLADIEGSALRSVSSTGEVTTHLDADDGLLRPNDLRIGPDGRVYLTDTCSGEVYRYDPTSGEVEDTISFDALSEGGPNGIAFNAEGELFLTTETTISLCGHSGDPTTPVAGLYRVVITDEGFGEREILFANIAQFGDGLAFDSEGNLYGLFDRLQGLEFESIMLVLPAEGNELRPFLSTNDRVMANTAFGRGDYGERTLYIAILAFPPFFTYRGVNTFELGISGLRL